ncbi:MAG TPA: IS200/IS605 family transposase [Candidatus Angelobacter sp.]|nr:IS200/IS605 family transposase [Candidatus Angelobacter sp.]
MSHTFARIHIHVIFSTKDRKKLIPKEVQPELWSYMAGICRNKGITPIAINGTDNHAHVLFHLPQDVTLAKAVNLVKTNSSKWMNEHRRKFAWQEGYGAFSVSESSTWVVINYIRNQEKHHRNRTFEEEYLALLKKHKVKFDPKYVFG